MDLEKIATSAVELSISQTDRLSSFINSGDKEPCWDGNIYIHEDKDRTKKSIKRVSVQVKGKAVSTGTIKDSVKYPVSFDDLNAYMMDGGTLFFVVHIDKSSRKPVQIYYSSLLPFKIKEILKEVKTKYQIKCKKFPVDNNKKTELLLSFYADAQRQASFAGKETPSIEELIKSGALESLTFHYTGLHKDINQFSLPKEMDGKELTLYANVKGCSIPIPVQYFDSVYKVSMSNTVSDPVSVNGTEYYRGYTHVATADHIELQIGSCVNLVFPNVEAPKTNVTVTINITIKGSLKERIQGIEFILAMREHGSLTILNHEFPIDFPALHFTKERQQEYRELLSGYKKAQALLDALHVSKDLAFDDCTEEDLSKLNLLIATILDGKKTKRQPTSPAQVQTFTVANLSLAIVYLPEEPDKFALHDYFGNHFRVEWQDQDKEPIQISQFSTMLAADFLKFDNLDLAFIIEDYKSVPMCGELHEIANATMLEMLKAFDQSDASCMLDAAKDMVQWLATFPAFTTPEVITLNELQIAKRERPLTFAEQASLYDIATKAEDPFYKIGALLLLDIQNEAAVQLSALPAVQQQKFKDFPIYRRYYHASKENEKNG